MKREIKFRAFIDGEMIDGDSLAFEEYAPISKLLTNCENIMQYTGLKDKNGVQIFEGDGVDFIPPVKTNGFWDSNCGRIMLKNEIDSLRIVFKQSDYLSLNYSILFIKD